MHNIVGLREKSCLGAARLAQNLQGAPRFHQRCSFRERCPRRGGIRLFFSLSGLVVVLLLSLLTPFCRLGNKKKILEMQASFKSGQVDYNLLLGKC